jgi:two-component system, OmpR family, osmolarity sensor histidine kinase EnvZ
VSLGGWYQLYRVFERNPQTARVAWEIASIVNLTRAALIAAAGERRSELLVDLARNEGVRVYPAEAHDQVEPLEDRQIGERVEAKLKERLGPSTRVAGKVNGEKALWISFDIDLDEYWLIVDPQRLERQLGGNWLQISAAVVLLALIGAILISRLVNRPLADLARSIERLSRGDRPPRLSESGPTEISELNQRFNQLAGDLHAMEADRAVVLAGVSHDIRTPLTRLRLEIELSKLDEASKESMVEEIDRIDSIVRQFIEYARPPDFAIEVVDVHRLVEQLLRSYARERAEGLLQLEIRLESGLRWQGNSIILQRILGNLFDNAMKYGRSSQDGVGRVRLTGRRRGRAVELVLADQGPGVPPEALERLSQPFARLDTERGGVGGSGLGLAVVSRLARRAGGTLTLQNAQGGGLVARVSLHDQGSQELLAPAGAGRRTAVAG